MMKLMYKEDRKNVKEKRLRAKRKKDKEISHSPHLVKGNNNCKKVITNARLTVPHMQPGIFLKGKSTVSYQRKQGAKFNELNKARMKEKLTDILNFANNSNLVTMMDYKKENVEISKGYSLLGDEKEEETLSINYSTDSLKNKHRRVQEKNYVSLHSSEDTSEEENEEEGKYAKNFNNNALIKKMHNEEKELEEDSNYLQFKKFLLYFDKHVSFKGTMTDFILTEKEDLKRKRRKSFTDSHSHSISMCPNVNKNNMKTSCLFKIAKKECENKSNKKSSNVCLQNVRYVKAKSPKRNANYKIFQSRNPSKLKIINQSQGHTNNQEDGIVGHVKTTKFYENTSDYNGPIFESEQVPREEEEEKNCSKIKHSCDKTVHTEDISLLNPLNFLEITMSQPDPLHSVSMSSKSDSYNNLQVSETDIPSSSFSGPPDLCISHKNSHFKKQERKSETFFDVYNTHDQNEPPPSPLHSDIFLNNNSEQIFYEPSSSLNPRFKEDRTFLFLDTEPKACIPDSPQKFLVLSPLTSDAIDIDYCSSGKRNLSKHQMCSLKGTPPDKYFEDGSQIYTKSLREPCLVSTYHPQVNLSSISSKEESDIRKNNFWHRRKMY